MCLKDFKLRSRETVKEIPFVIVFGCKWCVYEGMTARPFFGSAAGGFHLFIWVGARWL